MPDEWNMGLFQLKNKKVTVVGAGKSGLSAATLLAKEGAKVLVVDDQEQTIASTLPASVRFHLGGWDNRDLTSADLIVLSPGVPISRLPVPQLIKGDIPLISEVELAASRLSSPILAITGTNGKSTTTTLVGEILKAAGWRVFVGGNLGIPLSEAVCTKWDFIVAELSSFQLETIHHFHPRIAALLNISSDHLDRYPDFFAYRRAKWRIFENQSAKDEAIINLDNPHSIPPSINSATVYLSRNQAVERGLYLDKGAIISTIFGAPEQICRLSELQMKSAFPLENILAACAMTLLCGCSIKGIAKTLTSFKGLPHRMEFVRELRGVWYINDSKGTNIGAMMKSLEALQQPVTLIAGGRDKGADFSPLQSLIKKKVKQLILIGEAQEKMGFAFSNYSAVEKSNSMEEAVGRAAALAKEGEVVLLSPGCASFDMFHDYQHRGDVFKEAVGGLS